ncbi:EamA family transporter RarD [Candidatus Neomarinimicrobiota bacterium]
MNNKGIFTAGSAYFLWGVLPVYWKLLDSVPSSEILLHRIIWALAFVAALLTWQRRWDWLWPALTNSRVIFTFIGTSILIAINWFTYNWAINAGYILDASLGYFITPLFLVFLGVVLLGERPLFWQQLALVFAGLGVLYLTFMYGAFPWIALSLTISFGLYGLLRKLASLSAIEGLTLETMLLSIPAVVALAYLENQGTSALGHAPLRTSALLILSGAVTAVPLILFAHGARRVPMMILGLLQYIAPTCQFIIGVAIYGEQVSADRLIGFGLVWVGLIIFTWDGIIRSRRGSAVIQL